MISCIINLDTRPELVKMEGHNNGVRHADLLVGNVRNKKRFLEGFDHEIVAYVDVHEPLPASIDAELRELCDCLVLRKHSRHYRGCDPFPVFNDVAYLQALSQARGDIVMHFDQDTCCFARDKSAVDWWLSHLESHRFVSYMSANSPKPVEDASFGKHTWVSTRAFACRREWLRFDELEAAIREPKTAYDRYGYPPRQCPWTEHFLSLMNEESVIYPEKNYSQIMIWCWSGYSAGTMAQLNAMPYDEVFSYVESRNGITYPNDLSST